MRKNVLLGFVLAWIGCLGSVCFGASKIRYGGTAAVSYAEEVITTDPVKLHSVEEFEISGQLHETLLRWDPVSGLVPSLAQELPTYSSDKKELQIRIHPNAVFQDGRPITSEVLIESWKRLLSPKTQSRHWWLLLPIEGAAEYRSGHSTKISGIEKINRFEFKVRLVTSMPAFSEVLAALPTAPVSRPVHLQEQAKTNPVGAGAFVLSSQIHEEKAWELEPFAFHVLGRPFFDRLVFRHYPNKRAAGLSFELEEVGFSPYAPSRRMSDFFKTLSSQHNGMVYLVINQNKTEEFPDNFLRVVSKVIDRKMLVEYLAEGDQKPTDELLYQENLPELQNDEKGRVEMAKQYLKKLMSGRWTPPFMEILIAKDDVLERSVAERIQMHMKDIGVVVSIIECTRDVLESRIETGNYDFYLEQAIALVHKPELQLLRLMARWNDEEVATFFRKLGHLEANPNRDAMVREMAREYLYRFPILPLFQQGRTVYVNNKTMGFTLDRSGFGRFPDAWMAE